MNSLDATQLCNSLSLEELLMLQTIATDTLDRHSAQLRTHIQSLRAGDIRREVLTRTKVPDAARPTQPKTASPTGAGAEPESEPAGGEDAARPAQPKTASPTGASEEPESEPEPEPEPEPAGGEDAARPAQPMTASPTGAGAEPEPDCAIGSMVKLPGP